jgi:leucyl aminopeptidase
MEIKINSKMVEVQNKQVLVMCLFKEEKLVRESNAFTKVLQHLKEVDKFSGEDSQIYHFTMHKDNQLQDVVFLGLGEKSKLTHEKVRKSVGKAVKKVKELKCNHIAFDLTEIGADNLSMIIKASVEGACLADYEFNKYRTDYKETKLESFAILLEVVVDDSYDQAIQEGKILAESTALARDLTNEPANILGPVELAEKAEKTGHECGFEVEVFEESKIMSLGMKSFLAVAQGSGNPPRFIVMRYFGNPQEKENILGFVGKGLTYDSGGYSIKPTDGMVTMKSDMGGAAAVIGAMAAISKAKLPVNVIAVVAACENMISGSAYKPGDIIDSMAGKKIEVLNTDAEGRLTLADAIYYAVNVEKVTKVVDIATLTGAVLVALGKTITGVVTNNQQFFQMLQNASDQSGEKVWQLPNDEEYKKLIKSEIADLKNTGGRLAGTIAAGLFIGEFVGECPWLHLDIAGTSWSESSEDYFSKGGTGVGVRTLYYLASNMKF